MIGLILQTVGFLALCFLFSVMVGIGLRWGLGPAPRGQDPRKDQGRPF